MARPATQDAAATPRQLFAWAVYDWAATPFFAIIITFVFPAYFIRAVAADEVTGTTQWGYAIALSGLTIALLLNGTVVVETIFNYRGLGMWFATAAVQVDIPAVIGFGLVVAIIIVFANLFVDVLYAIVDPRIRYD